MADSQTRHATGKAARRRSGSRPPTTPRHAASPSGRKFEPGPIGAGLAATALTVSTLMAVPQAQARARGLPPPVRLPLTIDQSPAYVPQVSCDPAVKPGVAKFRRLVLATYRRGSDLGIASACRGPGHSSEHYEGRAWDWGVNIRDRKDMHAVTDLMRWLLGPGRDGRPAANARRLGIMYMIFNGRIWSSYRAPHAWRPYSGPDAHTGHVHFSFSWPGAWRRTSFWSGRPSREDYGPCRAVAGAYAPRYSRPNPRPCPPPAAAARPASPAPLAAYRGQVLRFGQTSAAVRALQQALRIRPATGYFGPLTLAAVRRFQAARRIPATGTIGPLTWNALVPRRPAPPRLSPTAVALRRHAGPVLRPGTRSEAVRLVQTVLRVRPATGDFGPLTLTAVRRYQVAHGIPATGNVGPMTWRSLVASVR